MDHAENTIPECAGLKKAQRKVIALFAVYFSDLIRNQHSSLVIRCVIDLAPVVQRVDNAIHRINRYPADKCWQNKLRYPLDSDLSGG